MRGFATVSRLPLASHWSTTGPPTGPSVHQDASSPIENDSRQCPHKPMFSYSGSRALSSSPQLTHLAHPHSRPKAKAFLRTGFPTPALPAALPPFPPQLTIVLVSCALVRRRGVGHAAVPGEIMSCFPRPRRAKPTLLGSLSTHAHAGSGPRPHRGGEPSKALFSPREDVLRKTCALGKGRREKSCRFWIGRGFLFLFFFFSFLKQIIMQG